MIYIYENDKDKDVTYVHVSKFVKAVPTVVISL